MLNNANKNNIKDPARYSQATFTMLIALIDDKKNKPTKIKAAKQELNIITLVVFPEAIGTKKVN